MNSKWLVKAVNQKLKDIFIQTWISKLDIESESNIYHLFKSYFEISKYVSILPTHLCKVVMAFRTRNHRLPVETGRWRVFLLGKESVIFVIRTLETNIT